MKRLSVSAIALALGMGSALAADLPYRKAPPPIVPPPPPLTWNGFYAGLNIGGGWENNNHNNNQWNLSYDPNYAFGGLGLLPPFPVGGVATNLFFLPGWNNNGSQGGVVGGGQIGYNFQFNPSIVVGVEADFQGTSIGNNNNNNNWNAAFLPSPFIVPPVGPATGTLIPAFGNNGWDRRGLSYFGTVRGRLGWLFTPTLLVYGTGGFAYGGSSFFNNVGVGWTAGGGLEWMFAPNWSAKVEYLFVQIDPNHNWGNNGFGFGWGNGWNRHEQVNVVRAGVNYHFNWAAPAPVLAKY